MRRDLAAQSAYVTNLNLVGEMLTVHLGNKEMADASGLPVKSLSSLDKPDDDDRWVTKDFEPIRDNGDKATALQIAVGYQNIQRGYPSRNPVPRSEFYKVAPGKVPETSDYQSIFRTLDEKSPNKARIVILHDSC